MASRLIEFKSTLVMLRWNLTEHYASFGSDAPFRLSLRSSAKTSAPSAVNNGLKDFTAEENRGMAQARREFPNMAQPQL